MRKWNRDRNRPRRRRPDEDAEVGEAGSGEPAGIRAQATPPEEGQNASDPGSQDALQPQAAAQSSGAALSRSRSRRGRRKKKTPSTQPASPVTPLIPSYSETEGPRAPLAISITPGAPTGEAAELEMPSEPATAPPAPATQPPRQASKGAVVLSVGLPGSGKTTWFKRKGVTPLSSDLLRSLLFDNPTEQRHQDLVFSSLRSLLRARMIARMPANYVDATNLSPKERRHWIRMAREFGYEAHAVFFDVPLETCMERNRRRQRVVPEDVMQRMAAKLRPPTFDEGFSKIIVVRVRHRPAGEPSTAQEPAPHLDAEAEESSRRSSAPEEFHSDLLDNIDPEAVDSNE